MRLHSTALALALVGAAGSAAHADDPPPAPTPDAPSGDALTLPKGRVLLTGALEVNLSSGAAAKPISLAPDVWYGVSDALTVGLVHSTLGETGFMGGVGDSLCLTGSSNGCGHFYNNVALDARYALTHGALSWAFDGGLAFRSLSPVQMAVKLGALGRWHKDKLAVELEPELFFGLTNRDGTVDPVTMTATGANKDSLAVPVAVLYTVAPAIDVGAQTGLILPLEQTGDSWAIPLSLAAHYRVSTPLALSLAFSFPDLLGAHAAGADARSLTLGGSYAF